MKLLLVDDHTVFVETVVGQFLADCELTVAPTVADALAALPGRFDAALVDHDLPDGKGTEVVRALRGAGFVGTIVAISALADGNAALVSAGADRVCARGVCAHSRGAGGGVMAVAMKSRFLRRVTPLRRLRAWFPYTFLAVASPALSRAGRLGWSFHVDLGVPRCTVYAEGGTRRWRRATIATLERQGYVGRGDLAAYHPTSARDRDDEIAWLCRIDGRTLPEPRVRRRGFRAQGNGLRDVDAALASDVAWSTLALGVSRRGVKDGWGIVVSVLVHVDADGDVECSVDVQFHHERARRDAPALARLVAGLGGDFAITMVTAGFVIASRAYPLRVRPREACRQIDGWFRRLAIEASPRGP